MADIPSSLVLITASFNHKDWLAYGDPSGGGLFHKFWMGVCRFKIGGLARLAEPIDI
jgi:hypothetical protein